MAGSLSLYCSPPTSAGRLIGLLLPPHGISMIVRLGCFITLTAGAIAGGGTQPPSQRGLHQSLSFWGEPFSLVHITL